MGTTWRQEPINRLQRRTVDSQNFAPVVAVDVKDHRYKESLMSIAAEAKPAIEGGQPAKTAPYTKALKFDDREMMHLAEALEQQTLFYAFGKKVKQFEAAVAAKYGSNHVICTSSGTASIHAALIAAGISPGDEVIVSPVTDMGSVGPILWQGGIPVFADLHPTRHVMTADTVEAVVTERTRAVIAVHLWGNAADPKALRQLCDLRDITLIEDCAQAYGCTENGVAVGTIGHMGAFSLNDFKHISAGDGGFVLTDDDSLAKRLRLATDKGYSREKEVAERNPSFLCNNYRLTELQAAVALAQLEKLDSIIERRQRWCLGLSRRLADLPGLVLPLVSPGCEASWWFYMLRVDTATLGVSVDDFVEAMNAEGIPLAAHYIGRPMYDYPIFANHSAFERGDHAYKSFAYSAGLCPVAEELLRYCAILPINEGYTDADLEETVLAFEKCVRWSRAKLS